MQLRTRTHAPRVAADRAIAYYQRVLSPRKGWRCAHGAVHGGATCSAAIRGHVARLGVLRALRPTVLQFLACYQAAALAQNAGVQGVCCCGPIPIPFRF
ncbi:membrane protein insertion efficiency factor YidD [Propioniciclava soli]|uniref:membrane protein insertion efficiency factor YidD n=1 Tax=Propioniciclava soli TaxID=2775081 RepID=UPI001E407710|nr:membrane protein insertion efficiency factor YidD [Propioniciclava soli]